MNINKQGGDALYRDWQRHQGQLEGYTPLNMNQHLAFHRSGSVNANLTIGAITEATELNENHGYCSRENK